ncbi:ubiquitin family protein [Aspergillus tubingensis]|uniref:ubiquitin family protein n=1 Tax=Aspergillus tubingensis TaxID=5068 RepID=UPI001577B7B7|nr:ubiquitin family protein [Aspergillus tubingensis]GFN18586.1 ubiquitin family protein [Aspergillus tubingensis]
MENIDTSPSCEGNDKGENAVLNTFDLYLDNIDESTVVPSETHREDSPLGEELSQIRLPASFNGLMDDYSLALGTGHECAEMAFPRLDAILFLLLAEMKKRYPTALQPSDYTPSFFSQVPLVVDRRVTGVPDSYQETVDYMLCYGSIPALETNLLVFRDKVLHSDARTRTAISVINRVRRNNRLKAAIYGIYTNSYQWTFLNYDDNGVVL